MLYIETKPLHFSRKDIQDILQDNHVSFRRSNFYAWEYLKEKPPSENSTQNIPLSFYEHGNPYNSYQTECLIEGPNLYLKYFTTPKSIYEKKPLQEAINYVTKHIGNPHKDVLLKLLKSI